VEEAPVTAEVETPAPSEPAAPAPAEAAAAEEEDVSLEAILQDLKRREGRSE
jgi:hypothetical protein